MFIRLKEWFKDHKDAIIRAVLIFLIVTASFGLGYLFKGQMEQAPIVIEKCSK